MSFSEYLWTTGRGNSTMCVGFKHLAHISSSQLHHCFIAREWFEFLFPSVNHKSFIVPNASLLKGKGHAKNSCLTFMVPRTVLKNLGSMISSFISDETSFILALFAHLITVHFLKKRIKWNHLQ